MTGSGPPHRADARRPEHEGTRRPPKGLIALSWDGEAPAVWTPRTGWRGNRHLIAAASAVGWLAETIGLCDSPGGPVIHPAIAGPDGYAWARACLLHACQGRATIVLPATASQVRQPTRGWNLSRLGVQDLLQQQIARLIHEAEQLPIPRRAANLTDHGFEDRAAEADIEGLLSVARLAVAHADDHGWTEDFRDLPGVQRPTPAAVAAEAALTRLGEALDTRVQEHASAGVRAALSGAGDNPSFWLESRLGTATLLAWEHLAAQASGDLDRTAQIERHLSKLRDETITVMSRVATARAEAVDAVLASCGSRRGAMQTKHASSVMTSTSVFPVTWLRPSQGRPLVADVQPAMEAVAHGVWGSLRGFADHRPSGQHALTLGALACAGTVPLVPAGAVTLDIHEAPATPPKTRQREGRGPTRVARGAP